MYFLEKNNKTGFFLKKTKILIFGLILTVSILSSSAATDGAKIFFWDSFSVKFYCSINNIFNINSTKCDEYISSVEASGVKQSNKSVHNESSEIVTTNVDREIINNNVNIVNPTNNPEVKTVIKTEYLPLQGPIGLTGSTGPIGLTGPRGEKGEKSIKFFNRRIAKVVCRKLYSPSYGSNSSRSWVYCSR